MQDSTNYQHPWCRKQLKDSDKLVCACTPTRHAVQTIRWFRQMASKHRPALLSIANHCMWSEQLPQKTHAAANQIYKLSCWCHIHQEFEQNAKRAIQSARQFSSPAQMSWQQLLYLQTICAVHFKPRHPHATEGVHYLQCVVLIPAPQELRQQAWNLLLRVVHDVGHIQKPVIEHCITPEYGLPDLQHMQESRHAVQMSLSVQGSSSKAPATSLQLAEGIS